MRVDFVPIWNTGFPKAVQMMIKEAVQGERNDELFYNELINRKLQASVANNTSKCNPIQKVYSVL